jgi:hypothetical protein
MNAATVARRSWLVVVALALSVPATAAVPKPCLIVDGASVGALRVGMPVLAALAIAGQPLSQQTVGTEVVFALRAPWTHMTVEYGIVRRISTRSPACRTARGIGTGATLAAVRQAYAGTPVSIRTTVPDGEILSFPFVGTRFLLRQGQVDTVEVFRAETLAQPSVIPPGPPGAQASPGPGAPTALPSPPAAVSAWIIRTTSAQATDTTLVIAGMVENRSRPASVYAEVRAFNGAGRLVAQGDSPLFPTPVPSGAIASFAVRLTIDDVVRRYVVIIRPVGSISVALAEQASEIKDIQQFASIVARQLQAVVQVTTNPPTRDDFVVVITNGSQFTVASVAVAVEIVATCRMVFPAPRSVQELRAGNVIVLQLRPGASARLPLPVSVGICIEFATWAATPRIGEVRLGD